MIGHRPRTTLISFVAALVGVGWLAVAIVPANATPMHRLTIRFGSMRVVLTVPSAWHVSRTSPTPQCGCGGDFNPVCIVASGDYGLDPNNCELMVGGNYDEQVPDEPVPGYRLPACDSWTTPYEADSAIGGYHGQYRTFLDKCHDQMSEQWTSTTRPSVAIWHPFHWTYDDTVAAKIVSTVRVVAKGLDQRVTNELGYLRNLTLHNGHAYATVDRVVRSLNGRMINHSPATYTHRLDRHRGYPGCRRWLIDCSAAQLRAQFLKGTHPADGTRPLDGRLVQMMYGTAWSLDSATRYKFESSGDSGHCGCG